jgi:hypothetical protein
MRSILLIGLAALAAATTAAAQTETTRPAAEPPAGTAATPAPNAPSAPPGAATEPTAPSAAAQTGAEAAGTVTVGQPVKDNTGMTIGKVTKVNPGPGGKQTAVIAMGAQSFAVDTSALAVQNGAAVINASQSEIQGMIAKSSAK